MRNVRQKKTQTMHLISLLRRVKAYKHMCRRCLCTETKRPSLLRHLQARIKASGPLSVAEYMKEVLTNPVSGYYMTRDVFGQEGDFITSPEISQMFGELLGIWVLNEWMNCGSPPLLQIVELGPGRGTLAEDMLRAMSNFPDIMKCASLHLVEVSPALAQVQHLKLSSNHTALLRNPTWRLKSEDVGDGSPYKSSTTKYGPSVHWYKDLKQVPKAFSCIIAHEFFDALPIYKFQKTHTGWREVLIDSVEGKSDLRFVLAPGQTFPSMSYLKHLSDNDQRDHIEVCPQAGVIVQDIVDRISADGGMALIADYGHDGNKTDTFRGFKKHQLHNVLEEPGSADLTADVDFSYLRNLTQDKVQTYGPISQSEYLVNMGIVVRLKMLLQKTKSEKERNDLISGYDMLTNKDKMGERFKFFAMLKKRQESYTPAGFKPPVENTPKPS